MKLDRQFLLTNLLLGAVVLVLLSQTGWQDWFDTDAITDSEEIRPDLVAYNVEQLRFNKDGQKHYLLKARQVQQFLDSDDNKILQPDLLLFRDQLPAWKTTADEGNADQQGDIIHLRGNVRIEQQGTPKPATLETTSLALSATRSQASTDDPVVIRQPGVLIKAVGLEADLTDNHLILKHQVNSRYEPEKKS